MRNLCTAIIYFRLQINVNMASPSTKSSNPALYRMHVMYCVNEESLNVVNPKKLNKKEAFVILL